MDKIHNKNVLFYSIHPNDYFSKMFMIELHKYPHLKKQFILICVSDPNIKIPQKIKDIGMYPVLVSPGFKDFISGEDVVSLLKNGGFQGKANGMEFGSFNDIEISQYALLADEAQNSDYHQYHNADYNRGFDLKDGNVNSAFSRLTAEGHVTTYDDSGEKRNDTDKLNKRLNDLKNQRRVEVPSELKRIGGMGIPTDPVTHKNTNNTLIQPNVPKLPFQNQFIPSNNFQFQQPIQQLPFQQMPMQVPMPMPQRQFNNNFQQNSRYQLPFNPNF